MEFSATKAITLLTTKGFRITLQRKAILSALEKIDHHQPFSVETILKLVQKNYPKLSCDFSSVYRNLLILKELDVVRHSEAQGESTFYQLNDHSHKHQHYIMCKKCKKYELIDFCAVIGQENLLLKLGYQDINHRLEFFGICPKCLGRKPKKQSTPSHQH